jgi:glycogen operon protein
MLLDGRAQKTGIRRHAEDDTVLLITNSFDGLVEFTLPEVPHGSTWKLLIDTNIPDGAPGEEFSCGSVYQVTARSVLLFGLQE